MLKKALAIILLAVSALTASAEFRWGPQVGYNYSDFYWKQDLVSSKGTSGFQAGLVGEVMIPGIGFGIDFGLLYNMHGGKVDLVNRWLRQRIRMAPSALRTAPSEVQIHPFRRLGTHNRPVRIRRAGIQLHARTRRQRAPRVSGRKRRRTSRTRCGAFPKAAGVAELHLGAYIRDTHHNNFSARSQHWGVNVAWFF